MSNHLNKYIDVQKLKQDIELIERERDDLKRMQNALRVKHHRMKKLLEEIDSNET